MYTKEQVINERRCGLKQFDKAVHYTSIDIIIEDSIKIFTELHEWVIQYPTLWDGFAWAFGNAWRNIICKTEKHNRDISCGANLDEMLTLEQIDAIKTRLCITEPYKPEWKRKKSK